MAQVRVQELRIGNLFNIIDRSREVHLPSNLIGKVGGIGRFDVFLYRHDQPFYVQDKNWYIPIADLSPIPLTEEWLVKFGFEIETKYSHSMGYKKNYKVYRKDLFTYNGIQAAWWFDNKVLRIQPEYAHQLQNLFHTLTGEELTINHRSRPRGL